jgi:hypothetical protein
MEGLIGSRRSGMDKERKKLKWKERDERKRYKERKYGINT